jgi:branched-subunit amino acid aminotransferase/4-amino-4-deoxychorismate lyase
MPVSEGVFTLGNALRADEMFVMSSTRGVIRVESVGTVEMPDKSYSGALANAMNEVANSM